MAKVITVANQKGGCGKTTTSICLAQELISRKYKVLFIDADAQCNSTTFYGAKTKEIETLLDIVCGDVPANECVQHTERGDIIPSDPGLVDAENMIKVDERRFNHLKRSLKSVKDDYDYIVIDTPPAIGVMLKNVLAATDYVVIPVQESGWSVDGLLQFSYAIELAAENNENIKIAGILIVDSQPRTSKSARMETYVNEAAKKMNTIAFKAKVHHSVKCSEALTEYGVPLNEYAPQSKPAEDYKQFTTELLEVINNG